MTAVAVGINTAYGLILYKTHIATCDYGKPILCGSAVRHIFYFIRPILLYPH